MTTFMAGRRKCLFHIAKHHLLALNFYRPKTGNGKQTRQGVGEVGDRVWEIHRADREIKTGTGRQQIQRVGDRGDKE